MLKKTPSTAKRRKAATVTSQIVETTDAQANLAAFRVPRQVARQLTRMKEKQQRSAELQQARKDAGKALRDRQTQREKAGFYDGQRPTAANMAGSRKTPDAKRKIRKRQPFGRILRTLNGMSYHATRGWIRYVAE